MSDLDLSLAQVSPTFITFYLVTLFKGNNINRFFQLINNVDGYTQTYFVETSSYIELFFCQMKNYLVVTK